MARGLSLFGGLGEPLISFFGFMLLGFAFIFSERGVESRGSDDVRVIFHFLCRPGSSTRESVILTSISFRPCILAIWCLYSPLSPFFIIGVTSRLAPSSPSRPDAHGWASVASRPFSTLTQPIRPQPTFILGLFHSHNSIQPRLLPDPSNPRITLMSPNGKRGSSRCWGRVQIERSCLWKSLAMVISISVSFHPHCSISLSSRFPLSQRSTALGLCWCHWRGAVGRWSFRF